MSFVFLHKEQTMRSFVRILCVVLGLAALPLAARAQDVQSGDLTVSHAWARGTATEGAAFLTVTNIGTEADRLVGASTPVAARAELHSHMMEDGVMKMRPVDGIDVPAHGVAELKPGAFHVMLIGLKEPLPEGKTIPLTLRFAHAGEVTVNVMVMALKAMPSDGGMMMQHHGM